MTHTAKKHHPDGWVHFGVVKTKAVSLRLTGISHGLKIAHQLSIFTPVYALGSAFQFPYGNKKSHSNGVGFFIGDPYGNRTHVTAVKGRCLNRLTNGPGSGDLIRTGDIPGMNRLLYQLSYAAMGGHLISV